MRVLVACEFSGVVRDAFIARGHDAVSCDLLPSERPGPHIQGDVLDVLSDGWDIAVCHPPCTFLCNSGVRWLAGSTIRKRKMKDAAVFFAELLNCDIPKVAVENPIMHRYGKIYIGRGQDQVIQPWQFGHKEMKATCLWLKGLPLLKPSHIVGPPPKDPAERKHWAVVHRASPGPDRWKKRSITYQGIADAMAEQWGSLP